MSARRRSRPWWREMNREAERVALSALFDAARAELDATCRYAAERMGWYEDRDPTSAPPVLEAGPSCDARWTGTIRWDEQP